jgi:hypothetical protein
MTLHNALSTPETPAAHEPVEGDPAKFAFPKFFRILIRV